MNEWLLIFSAICFTVEALWHRSVLAVGLFFWVFSQII